MTAGHHETSRRSAKNRIWPCASNPAVTMAQQSRHAVDINDYTQAHTTVPLKITNWFCLRSL